MSNGQACCILGVCCPPPKQAQALVNHLQQQLDRVPAEYSTKNIVDILLRDFDIVPKGVGSLIVYKYTDVFRQKFQDSK